MKVDNTLVAKINELILKGVFMKVLSIACTLTGLFIFLHSACLSYQIELAVCGIFQNEGRFLKEWIEFHKLVGVQRFYLYNNNSTDNYNEILRPYVETGEVELFDWPESDRGLRAQVSAYNDCLAKTKSTVKWVAFLDLDEFLYPIQEFKLTSILKEYEEFGEVSVNWFMFGTSDVSKIPDDELMIEYLTKCDPKGNKHVKSIVRPDHVTRFSSPHFAQCLPNYVQVNPEKKGIKGFKFFSPEISYDKIRINHYWTRDKYHLETIKIPRVKNLNANHMVLDNDSWYIPRSQANNMSAAEWILAVNDHINVADDYSIAKYIPLLKETLKK